MVLSEVGDIWFGLSWYMDIKWSRGLISFLKRKTPWV